MKNFFLALSLIASTSSFAVNFDEKDKQNDFIAGCGVSSMFRGFALDANASHKSAVALGLSSSLVVSYIYESSKPILQTQDIVAMTIGSVACMSVAEGFALMVKKNGVNVVSEF